MDRHFVLRRIWLWLAVLAALGGYILWGNTSITVTQLHMEIPGLPEEFSGFRIAHVSDLHNASFGRDNGRLLELLAQNEPDIIAMTGDLIDSRRTRVDISADFAAKAAQLAPTYSVTGNHEGRVREDYARLKQALENSGVHILENETVILERGNARITLMGLHDPSFSDVQTELTRLAPGTQETTILLAHHPELVGSYAGAGIDLALCGHAHGGQFRFPLLGGLIAPGQGWFPVYDAGAYRVEDTQMVVSRGLGNSLFPFRLNNRPEVILITLNAKTPD